MQLTALLSRPEVNCVALPIETQKPRQGLKNRHSIALQVDQPLQLP
jgi:hypothetical protein